MKRTANLKSQNTPIKAKQTSKRKSSIKARSNTSKRGKEQAQRGDFNKKIMERSRGLCEAGPMIWEVDKEAAKKCQQKAVDVHEPLTRARGGSILDENNALAICRNCHRLAHEQPEIAEKAGLLKHSWDVVQ